MNTGINIIPNGGSINPLEFQMLQPGTFDSNNNMHRSIMHKFIMSRPGTRHAFKSMPYRVLINKIFNLSDKHSSQLNKIYNALRDQVLLNMVANQDMLNVVQNPALYGIYTLYLDTLKTDISLRDSTGNEVHSLPALIDSLDLATIEATANRLQTADAGLILRLQAIEANVNNICANNDIVNSELEINKNASNKTSLGATLTTAKAIEGLTGFLVDPEFASPANRALDGIKSYSDLVTTTNVYGDNSYIEYLLKVEAILSKINPNVANLMGLSQDERDLLGYRSNPDNLKAIVTLHSWSTMECSVASDLISIIKELGAQSYKVKMILREMLSTISISNRDIDTVLGVETGLKTILDQGFLFSNIEKEQFETAFRDQGKIIGSPEVVQSTGRLTLAGTAMESNINVFAVLTQLFGNQIPLTDEMFKEYEADIKSVILAVQDNKKILTTRANKIFRTILTLSTFTRITFANPFELVKLFVVSLAFFKLVENSQYKGFFPTLSEVRAGITKSPMDAKRCNVDWNTILINGANVVVGSELLKMYASHCISFGFNLAFGPDSIKMKDLLVGHFGYQIPYGFAIPGDDNIGGSIIVYMKNINLPLGIRMAVTPDIKPIEGAQSDPTIEGAIVLLTTQIPQKADFWKLSGLETMGPNTPINGNNVMQYLRSTNNNINQGNLTNYHIVCEKIAIALNGIYNGA